MPEIRKDDFLMIRARLLPALAWAEVTVEGLTKYIPRPLPR